METKMYICRAMYKVLLMSKSNETCNHNMKYADRYCFIHYVIWRIVDIHVVLLDVVLYTYC